MRWAASYFRLQALHQRQFHRVLVLAPHTQFPSIWCSLQRQNQTGLRAAPKPGCAQTARKQSPDATSKLSRTNPRVTANRVTPRAAPIPGAINAQNVRLLEKLKQQYRQETIKYLVSIG